MGASIATGGPGESQADINITPLVDVVLVLLIIFMVAQPILQLGLDVEVPPKVEVLEPPPPNSMPQLVLSVRRTGYFLNADKLADYGEADLTKLQEAIAKQCHPSVRPNPGDRVVFITADDTVPFDYAVRAMDVAHAAGAKKIGFLTEAR
jgi:biopolymer transport protein ExbD